jgi:glycosyltransferase involved in cell wall biosynthesis
VYNGAFCLAKTLDSILSQEGVEFEFIVVNDGSSDKSGQILNDYAQRDSRLRIIHQENTGLTRALIRGCDAVRGEFIARQDAGDIS